MTIVTAIFSSYRYVKYLAWLAYVHLYQTKSTGAVMTYWLLKVIFYDIPEGKSGTYQINQSAV
jgi:hypothetical protein